MAEKELQKTEDLKSMLKDSIKVSLSNCSFHEIFSVSGVASQREPKHFDTLTLRYNKMPHNQVPACRALR